MPWEKFNARTVASVATVAEVDANSALTSPPHANDKLSSALWAAGGQSGHLNRRPGNFAFPRMPPATLATSATVQPESSSTVANVASVAAPHVETAHQSVATVATVAGVHVQSEHLEGVPPVDVAMLFERIVTHLMRDGRGRAEAEQNAMPVLRARLANDARLMPFTKFSTICAVCSGEEVEGGNPLLPILSSRQGSHIWLHAGDCHQQHRAQIAERVEACISAAGLTISKGVAA